MGAVGKLIKKATGFLVGGDKKPVQGSNYAPMSEEEYQRLSDIENQIESLFGEQGSLANKNLQQSQEIQNLFANNLKSFLTTGGQQTPEQLKQASDFVDQTFTAPAQNALNQSMIDYENRASAKAAALGRNPNADVATNQAIAAEGMRQNLGLQAERGQRIQQASQDIYNRGLGSLNAGLQGGQFLNNLGQQAFNNRLSLLNGRTGLADFYQRERGKTTAGTQTSTGALTNLASIGGTAAGIGAMGGLGGIGSSVLKGIL